MEPEEISFLFTEREATLESIRDATITINIEKHITSMNKRARELFHDDQLIVEMLLLHKDLEKYINEAIGTKELQFKKLLLSNNYTF